VSPTGIRFTHLLGAVFVVGGIVFMLFLKEHRFLFGIPYVVIGGARGVSRRASATADQAGVGSPDIDDAAEASASSDSSASSIRPER
jgi:hypothetical protein